MQFCAIQRRDNNEWAIPGGMVDPGESVSLTLQREFSEEALNALKLSEGKLLEVVMLFYLFILVFFFRRKTETKINA